MDPDQHIRTSGYLWPAYMSESYAEGPSTSVDSSALEPDARNKLSWSTPGSAQRNLPHLLAAHQPILSRSETRNCLELASGFLDHCSAYAGHHPGVRFWPTECDQYLVRFLHEATERSGRSNIAKPLKLDILDDVDWQRLRKDAASPFDVIIVTNLLNVTPWTVTQALFRQLAESADPILNRKNGILTVYCCLRVGGQFRSVADEKFNAELRGRSADFGIRDLDDVLALAEEAGLELQSQAALGGGTNLFLTFAYT